MALKQSRPDNLCMVMEMRMKEEGLLEKRERDLRKKVFCSICFPGKLPVANTELIFRVSCYWLRVKPMLIFLQRSNNNQLLL